MLFDGEKLSDRLTLGEDSRWEFEQIVFDGETVKNSQRDSLAQSIAAFANADGGYLLCGVQDDGTVQPMNRARLDNLTNLLAEISRDNIQPSLEVSINKSLVRENEPVVVVSVPRGTSAHRVKGKGNEYYRRHGDSTQRIPHEEAMRLIQRRGQSPSRSFDHQPVEDTGFGTLEPRLWQRLLDDEDSHEAPEVSLEKLGLLAIKDNGDTVATVAGILLCTESPDEWIYGAAITATAFRGTDLTSDQLDARTITGPLDRQITEALAFVTRNSRVQATKSPERIETPQYSINAVFEAIVNAVVHRDYSITGSKIRIFMFDDRLEIYSPGALPNSLTTENMSVRQSTRNETIVSIMRRIPFHGADNAIRRRFIMEESGRGVPTIIQETETLTGDSPIFDDTSGDQLQVTIPAATIDYINLTLDLIVLSQEEPVPDATISVFYRDGESTIATTDSEGRCKLYVPASAVRSLVYVTKDGYRYRVISRRRLFYSPSERDPIEVNLERMEDGGSATLINGNGNLPGLDGALVFRGAGMRSIYLYFSGGKINDGALQPVEIRRGDSVLIEDAKSARFMLRFVQNIAQNAIVQYYRINQTQP